MVKWANFIGNDTVVVEIGSSEEMDMFKFICRFCRLYGVNTLDKLSYAYIRELLLLNRGEAPASFCMEYAYYKGFTFSITEEYLANGYQILPFNEVRKEFDL